MYTDQNSITWGIEIFSQTIEFCLLFIIEKLFISEHEKLVVQKSPNTSNKPLVVF